MTDWPFIKRVGDLDMVPLHTANEKLAEADEKLAVAGEERKTGGAILMMCANDLKAAEKRIAELEAEVGQLKEENEFLVDSDGGKAFAVYPRGKPSGGGGNAMVPVKVGHCPICGQPEDVENGTCKCHPINEGEIRPSGGGKGGAGCLVPKTPLSAGASAPETPEGISPETVITIENYIHEIDYPRMAEILKRFDDKTFIIVGSPAAASEMVRNPISTGEPPIPAETAGDYKWEDAEEPRWVCINCGAGPCFFGGEWPDVCTCDGVSETKWIQIKRTEEGTNNEKKA